MLKYSVIQPYFSFAVLAIFLLQGPTVFARIEEPAFQSMKKEGDFEIREYRGFIVAETFVAGNMDEAGSAGFRAIADYIFGNNISVKKEAGMDSEKANEKIAMTAPVTMEETREKIAMTAPVTMEKSVEKSAASRWRVHFVMPAQYTMQTLPKPVNANVTLREVPKQKMAVLRFSGFSTDEKVKTKTDELNVWMAKEGLKAAGAPQFARYNPPITPPFMRRSEILIPVE